MKIKKIIKFVVLFLFEMLFASLMVFVLRLFKIDIYKLSVTIRIIISFAISLLLMGLFYLVYHKDINRDFKDYVKNFKSYFSFSIKWWAIGFAIMILANVVIYSFLHNSSQNEIEIQNLLSISPLYILFSSCIYAPFVEELIYRKSIRDFISNNTLYILVSGLLFGFVHTLSGLYNGEVINTMEIIYIVPYAIMGCVFAYMYTKTDNIFTTMGVHLIHNLLSFLASIVSLLVIL